MARMPTRDDLPQGVARANTTIVNAPSDGIGEAMQSFGTTASRAASIMARKAEDDRKKQSLLERTKATAFFQRSLMEGEAQYTVENKPQIEKWGEDFSKGAKNWRDSAAKIITDPNDRELWSLQADTDVTRYSVNVLEKADQISDKRRSEELVFSMNQLVEDIAKTDSEEERAELFTRMRQYGRDGVAAGLWSPAYMADFDQKARHKVAGLRVERQIMDDPGSAYSKLSGRPNAAYMRKTGNMENVKRDPKARPRNAKGELLSSALGLFQFTHDTWERLRKNHPELGLTKSYGLVDNDLDGRLDREQQYRAMEKFTEMNAKDLAENGIVPTEATLYLAHFAGLQGAIDLLSADPTAPADRMFPKMAEGNGRHFVGKTVAGAIASLTKGFNGQPMTAGPEYASLSADQSIVLEKQARAAAEARWTAQADEAESDLLLNLTEEASALSSRQDSLDYLDDSEAASDVKIKARALINQRWNEKEAFVEENRKAAWQETYKTVQDGMDSGANRAALLKEADQLADQNDRAALRKYIWDGPPTNSLPEIVREIDELRYSSDPKDQKKFAEIDLTSPRMLSGLSTQARQEMFSQQQGVIERSQATGSDPVFTTVSQMRSSLANSMGLVIDKNADPEDVAVMDMVSREVQAALEGAYKVKGDTLTSDEMMQISDAVTIQWYKRTTINDGYFNDTTGSAAKAVSAAYESYKDKGNTLPLSVVWRKFNTLYPQHKNKPDQFANWLQDAVNARGVID